jgi:hypothetical protein
MTVTLTRVETWQAQSQAEYDVLSARAQELQANLFDVDLDPNNLKVVVTFTKDYEV